MFPRLTVLSVFHTQIGGELGWKALNLFFLLPDNSDLSSPEPSPMQVLYGPSCLPPIPSTLCSEHHHSHPTQSARRSGLRGQRAQEASQLSSSPTGVQTNLACLQTWAVCHSVGTTVSCPPKVVPDPDPGSLASASGWFEQVLAQTRSVVQRPYPLTR